MSKNFIIYNADGKILRTGVCQKALFVEQAKIGESVIKGSADDITQKIVNGEIIDKTPEEIEADKPSEPEPISHDDRTARISNKQLQDMLDRLQQLESNK